MVDRLHSVSRATPDDREPAVFSGDGGAGFCCTDSQKSLNRL